MCSSPKGIWRLVNYFRNKNVANDMWDKFSEDTPDIVNILTKHFSSSFNHNIVNSLNDIVFDVRNCTVNFVELNEVYSMLNNLCINKAHGHDGFSNRILRIFSPFIAEPLCSLINCCLRTCNFPQVWKYATVCPIPKCSSPSLLEFRPISLLPTMSKICEKIVLNFYRDVLISFYSEHQHAYRPATSSVTAIAQFHDTVTKFLDTSCKGVRVICFDLAKAFDSVRHDLLVQKIADNIGLPFANFVKNYLVDRSGKVFVKGISGDTFSFSSGVPQGSVLGPYLFNFFMGNLIYEFSRTFNNDNYLIIMYADDILVIEKVISFESHVSSVNFILNRFKHHDLKCNIIKCSQSFYAKGNLSSNIHPFANNYDNLPFVIEFKYLGVIFSSLSNFDTYIDYLVSRVSKRIYVIRSLKHSGVCAKELLIVYNSLILNVVLYALPLFWSFSKQNITELVKIHKRCHTIICGVGCDCAALPDIAYSRSVKLFNNCNRITHPLYYCIPEVLPSGRFRQPVVSTSRRFHSFFPYFANIFNNNFCRPR